MNEKKRKEKHTIFISFFSRFLPTLITPKKNLQLSVTHYSQVKIKSVALCDVYSSCLVLEGSEGLPVPPTWFNYMMWEASESLLSLSDCSPPEPFAYLSPDDDTAQHHTSSIIHEIFSYTHPQMTHYVESDSLVLLLSYVWRSRDGAQEGGGFGPFPSHSTEQTCVPLVMVAMTAGTAATGEHFAHHGIDWLYCFIYTGRGIWERYNINTRQK